MSFVVKVVNKKFGKAMLQYPNLKKYYGLFMKIIIKYHKLFGFLTIAFILGHFLIQFSKRGINITGAIAASVMLLQVVLGVLGAVVYKKRSGAWFVIHRFIAVLLIVVIGVHII